MVVFFNIVNTTNNIIVNIFSVDEKYKYGNLFNKGTISKLVSEINFKLSDRNFCRLKFKNFRELYLIQ